MKEETCGRTTGSYSRLDFFPDNELSAGKGRFGKITEQIYSIGVWQSKQCRNGVQLLYHSQEGSGRKKIHWRDSDIIIIKLQRTAYRKKKKGIIQT